MSDELTLAEAQEYRLMRRTMTRVVWLCSVCLAFAFACVVLKVEPSEKLLDFMIWIVGLTMASLTGRDGIEIFKSKKT